MNSTINLRENSQNLIWQTIIFVRIIQLILITMNLLVRPGLPYKIS